MVMPEADLNFCGSETPSDPPTGTYLGFDFGSKRIGVACGNTETRSAMPLSIVVNHNGTPDWTAIDKLVAEWQPQAMVVGKPLLLNDETQDITPHAMGFLRRLQRRYATTVFAADERFSSIQAAESIKKSRQLGLKSARQGTQIDNIAATHILQRWLDTQFNT